MYPKYSESQLCANSGDQNVSSDHDLQWGSHFSNSFRHTNEIVKRIVEI